MVKKHCYSLLEFCKTDTRVFKTSNICSVGTVWLGCFSTISK